MGAQGQVRLPRDAELEGLRLCSCVLQHKGGCRDIRDSCGRQLQEQHQLWAICYGYPVFALDDIIIIIIITIIVINMFSCKG